MTANVPEQSVCKECAVNPCRRHEAHVVTSGRARIVQNEYHADHSSAIWDVAYPPFVLEESVSSWDNDRRLG